MSIIPLFCQIGDFYQEFETEMKPQLCVNQKQKRKRKQSLH